MHTETHTNIYKMSTMPHICTCAQKTDAHKSHICTNMYNTQNKYPHVTHLYKYVIFAQNNPKNTQKMHKIAEILTHTNCLTRQWSTASDLAIQ